jgi:hypothetical protein
MAVAGGGRCTEHSGDPGAQLGIGERLHEHVVAAALDQPYAVKLLAVGTISRLAARG